ncbi:ester cyclase [Telmatobacter sp. DSM 110680]|uniref:Ester cyclase n=1 Tax=Telmatobacter sp. DSM 110680 TaxID=3036704 RepID=A0AAU7DN42_9BACT
MSEANRQLTKRWYDEVWNQRNSATIDEMFASSGKSHGFPEPDSVLIGPGHFKTLHATFCGAFPDLHFVLDDIICEGNRVAVRWTTTMTHLGDNLGFPASRKKASLSGSSFLIFENGVIIEGWNFMEMNGLLESLKQN